MGLLFIPPQLVDLRRAAARRWLCGREERFDAACWCNTQTMGWTTVRCTDVGQDSCCRARVPEPLNEVFYAPGLFRPETTSYHTPSGEA